MSTQQVRGGTPQGRTTAAVVTVVAMVAASAAAYVALRDPRPAPAPPDTARVVRLEDAPIAALTVPPHSRSTDADALPTEFPLDGPWYPDSEGPRHGYATQIPVRPRGLFFNRPEPAIRLIDGNGKAVPYEHGQAGLPVLWTHDRTELSVWFTTRDHPPAPGEFKLAYPRAVEREAALNLAYSGERPEDFVWTQIQDGWRARRGLLLPAPGEIAWDLDVPPAAELTFDAGIVLPEIADPVPSDGATLAVAVEADGAVDTVWTGSLTAGAFAFTRVDLSRWAGRTVRLRFTSASPSGSTAGDYVFAAEPVVASRKADPVRVLMVFIDTLRPDHTSLYGYERDTTASIDHLRSEGRVFTQAYSVAPWTLPSARAIVTGRQPEAYADAATVQGLLGRQGWANAFFAGNVYLSVNFGMDRDWDLHEIGGLWPPAEQVTDDALAWLADHDGRDAILQVHYMDAHLPYQEPRSYRRRYAGDAPKGLGDPFFLPDVKRANIANDPAGLQYIRDRYDNNIRYATDQAERLIAELDDNDVLLVYADHGEEFFEHGGYEHGHSLFNELIHVPLVIRAPGVTAGEVDAPVSLLDLAPTILDLVGQPIPSEMEGWSLGPLLRGDAGAEAKFRGRDLAFGRPLYGLERWGVLSDTRKWMTNEGREAQYDLANDPGEAQNLVLDDPTDQGAPFRDKLAQVLGREVPVSYRLTPTNYQGPPRYALWALCTAPGGFARAWPGDDPLKNAPVSVRRVDDPNELAGLVAAYQVSDHALEPGVGGVEMCWHGGGAGSHEVYLVPNGPLAEAGRGMVCSGYLGDASGGKRVTVRIPPRRDPGLGANRIPLARMVWPERQLLWQYGIGPVPAGTAVVARDGETDGMLQALGYQTGEEAELPEGETELVGLPCEPPVVTLAPLEAPPTFAPDPTP